MRLLPALLALLLAAACHAGEPKRDRHGDPLPEGAIARLGTVQAHPFCKTVAFSADGRSIITTGETAVRHWDLATGRVQRLIVRQMPNNVWQRISADGGLAATLYSDHLKLHDLNNNRSLHQLPVPSYDGIGMIAVSPRGETLVVSQLLENGQTQALIFRLPSGKVESLSEVKHLLDLPVFSADGSRLATSIMHGSLLCCWDIRSNRLLGKFQLDGRALAFTPDGQSVLVWTRESDALTLLDLKRGTARPLGKLPAIGIDAAAMFSADGRWLAVNTARNITVLDLKTETVLRDFPGGARALAFSPDGKKLAAADDLVRLFDVETGKSLWPDFGPLIGRNDHLGPLLTRPAGNQIATWNASQRRIQMWDWTTGTPRFATSVVGQWCTLLWLSQDGNRLHFCGERRVQTWDLTSGKELRRFSPIPEEMIADNWQVSSARESRDGRTLSVLLRKPIQDPDVRSRAELVRCDINDGRLLERRAIDMPYLIFSSIAPGCEHLLVRHLRIDLQRQRRQVVALPPDRFQGTTPLVTSRDGRFLAGHTVPRDRGPNELVVWEAASGKPLLRIPAGNDHYPQADISPDNRWLAVGGDDAVELWDLATGGRSTSRLAHEVPDWSPGDGSKCLGLMFLPGRRLIAGYRDWTALVWEMPAETAKPSPHRMGERTWDDLSALEPRPAQDAVWALVNESAKALELLRRIKPAATPADAELVPLIADLGATDFARREAAVRRLREHGHVIEKALENALAAAQGAEQVKRLKLLQEECRDDGPTTADERRAVRAVQALEQIGSAEARELLETWSKGAELATLTIEAKTAFERLSGNKR
jgi:WD40 repeat protein